MRLKKIMKEYDEFASPTKMHTTSHKYNDKVLVDIDAPIDTFDDMLRKRIVKFVGYVAKAGINLLTPKDHSCNEIKVHICTKKKEDM